MEEKNSSGKINLEYSDLIGVIISDEAKDGNHSIITALDLMFFKYLLSLRLTKAAGKKDLKILSCSINTRLKDGEDKERFFKCFPHMLNIGVWDLLRPADFVNLQDSELERGRKKKIESIIKRFNNLMVYKGLLNGAEVYSNGVLSNEILLNFALDEDYYKSNKEGIKLTDKEIEDLKSLELSKLWFDKDNKQTELWLENYNNCINALAGEISEQDKTVSIDSAKIAIKKALQDYKTYGINKINKGFIAGINKKNALEKSAFYVSGYNIGLGAEIELGGNR